MIFKAFFRGFPGKPKSTCPDSTICKVFAVENGQLLETRISNVINNLKADGFEVVELMDCHNISEPFDPIR